MSLPPSGPGAPRALRCCLQPLRAAPGPACAAERTRQNHCPLLPRPRLTQLSRHLEPTEAAPSPDACLPLSSTSLPGLWSLFSALGFGSWSPWSGGRATGIGKQRRRPVAGACPSPHPAGNLGGALGVSVCAAAPAGWGERAHSAAGRRRERGAGRGSGPGASRPPPQRPGSCGLLERPGSPGPGPQAGGHPLDGSGDRCLRTGAGERRGSRGKGPVSA